VTSSATMACSGSISVLQGPLASNIFALSKLSLKHRLRVVFQHLTCQLPILIGLQGSI
jgi:hypothetical protein